VEFVNKPYGQALAALGARHPDLVVVDADLQRATETDLFQHAFPHRHLDVGIAEANMVGVAAGLALSGKIVFCGTFASFITQRVADQVFVSVAYCQANVKLIGVEAGLSSGRNGASHQAVMDLAIMRAMPNMTVFVPADATEVVAIVEHLASHPGPAYVRMPRGKTPVLLDPATYVFRPGRAITLHPGGDVAILACGTMVPRALEAADLLAAQGIAARVVNMSSIKPLDSAAVIDAAAEDGCIVTAEDHSIVGGLGSAVCELLASCRPTPVIRVGIRDQFGEVGDVEWLAAKFGLSSTHIAQAGVAALALKSYP